jgi:hypothetical protein
MWSGSLASRNHGFFTAWYGNLVVCTGWFYLWVKTGLIRLLALSGELSNPQPGQLSHKPGNPMR